MIINLISSPRNISTALMYSFANRTDTKVMDEPFYAYYLNLTEANHPGKKEVLASQPLTVAGVRDWIAQIASQHRIVFIKNMAHHLINMDTTFLEEYKSVFLIRNPKYLITSFAKVIQNPRMEDIGVAHQYALYKTLSQSDYCPVIDSGELIKNPSSILPKLCQELGIDFEESMLSWPAKPLEEDGIWAKYWYNSVHHSTHFQAPSESNPDVPPHCEELYNESLTFYNTLKAKSITS